MYCRSGVHQIEGGGGVATDLRRCLTSKMVVVLKRIVQVVVHSSSMLVFMIMII